jgi:MarR family transcriptional regulator, organic hydroperoxide resistance regulator
MIAPLTVSRAELLRGESDADFRTLVHGLLAFAARLESVRGGFARLVGLTGIQYTVLISVAHLEGAGDVSVNMLAGHLQLSGAFVTIETGKLLKRGLLTKRQDRTDRRRVSLKTTTKGRGLLRSLAPKQVAVNDVLFEFLDPPGFRQLLGMVERMTRCGDRAVSLLDYLSEEKGRRR